MKHLGITEIKNIRDRIFRIGKEEEFAGLSLEVFRYQYMHCRVYREFVDALSIDPDSVEDPVRIPFMPIQFFKTREVIAEGMKSGSEFLSSGTTGMTPGRHLVADPDLYQQSLLRGFERQYGRPSEWTFLALTPFPEENRNSSLLYMLSTLMQQNPGNPHGFFLDRFSVLKETLEMMSGSGSKTIPGSPCDPGKKVILIGLTWALLDFAGAFPGNYDGLIVMETGGMKGRKEEITREELHNRLGKGFQGAEIHSEYGMTELLSQAYARPGGKFRCPPWMMVFIRELNDPLAHASFGKTGGISIIDLANLYSCSFIATQDLGRSYPGGTFEVLGRFDDSDLRGCSLMLA